MFKIIATFLDGMCGPEIYQDGVVDLKMHPKAFKTKEEAMAFIENDEVQRAKEAAMYESGATSEEVHADYSFDGKQAYIDVTVDMPNPIPSQYVGRYIYKVVEIH